MPLIFYKITTKETSLIKLEKEEIDTIRFISPKTLKMEIVNNITISDYVPHGTHYYFRIADWIETHHSGKHSAL